MIVGDDNFGAPKVREHIGRHEVEVAVVFVRIVGHQYTQTITNGDTWGYDEKPVGEAFAVLQPGRIDRLPGDNHGHDGGLTCACC